MQLNFKVFGQGQPLIILHGLLGSLDNWQSVARNLSATFQVFVVDQRNHGKSPHSEAFSYELLCCDLLDFFRQQNISRAHLIGHSMGGKVAMLFAMQRPERVQKLVVVDVAPVSYDDHHSHIFSALLAVDLTAAQSREQVENSLRHALKNEDEMVIQFLMKALYRTDDHRFAWRFNLKSLWSAYGKISAAVEGKPFEGETLFIKGQRSSYVGADGYDAIVRLFPNHHIAEVKNAGHWVHAENPEDFLLEVKQFLTA